MFGQSITTNCGYRSDSPLSNDTIRKHAPSVLADHPHESRGERYAFIPTIQVIDGLRKEGFEPYQVAQTRCRDLGKREFTKHMVRLRHATQVAGKEGVPEIILINSHDGASSYQLMAGYFRFVCSNGLIAGTLCEDIRVRHSGNIVGEVIEGSFEVLDNLKALDGSVDSFRSIALTAPEQLLLAEQALSLRYEKDEAPIQPIQLLRPRRSEDRSPDLWTTFNRVQENMLQGGVHGRSASGRRMSTRAVGGVNENVKLNRALWSLAEGMAKLKQAA